MFKRKIVMLLCTLFVISEIIVYTFFGLSGDILFFTSDIVSMYIVVIALSIMLFAVTSAIVSFLIIIFPSLRANSILYTGRLVAALIVTNFFFFLLNTMDIKFLITVRTKCLLSRYIPAPYPEIFWIIFWFVLFGYIWRWLSKPGKQIYSHRSSYLSLIIAPASIIIFFTISGYIKFIDQNLNINKGKTPKHAVLVVIDGWPSEFFKSSSFFNPSEPLRTKGLIYSNVH